MHVDIIVHCIPQFLRLEDVLNYVMLRKDIYNSITTNAILLKLYHNEVRRRWESIYLLYANDGSFRDLMVSLELYTEKQRMDRRLTNYELPKGMGYKFHFGGI